MSLDNFNWSEDDVSINSDDTDYLLCQKLDVNNFDRSYIQKLNVNDSERSHTQTHKVNEFERSYTKKLDVNNFGRSYIQKLNVNDSERSHTQTHKVNEFERSHTQKLDVNDFDGSYIKKLNVNDSDRSYTQTRKVNDSERSYTQTRKVNEFERKYTQTRNINDFESSYNQKVGTEYLLNNTYGSNSSYGNPDSSASFASYKDSTLGLVQQDNPYISSPENSKLHETSSFSLKETRDKKFTSPVKHELLSNSQSYDRHEKFNARKSTEHSSLDIKDEILSFGRYFIIL